MTASADGIVELLGGFRYGYSDELALQAGIESVLRRAGVEFAREVFLGPVDRPDFVVDRVAIEVKVQGSSADVLRQLHRYAQHDAIAELVLVTSRSYHVVPSELNGKPARSLWVGGAW